VAIARDADAPLIESVTGIFVNGRELHRDDVRALIAPMVRHGRAVGGWTGMATSVLKAVHRWATSVRPQLRHAAGHGCEAAEPGPAASGPAVMVTAMSGPLTDTPAAVMQTTVEA